MNGCEQCKRFYLELENVTKERDEALCLAYIGEHRFPDLSWKARCEEVVQDLRRAERERDQLREELLRLHRLAPTGTYTVSLPHEQEIQALRASRDKWAETARKLGEQLEWTNEMVCENTPTPGCECPGCSLARDRAERGVAGPEDER